MLCPAPGVEGLREAGGVLVKNIPALPLTTSVILGELLNSFINCIISGGPDNGR